MIFKTSISKHLSLSISKWADPPIDRKNQNQKECILRLRFHPVFLAMHQALFFKTYSRCKRFFIHFWIASAFDPKTVHVIYWSILITVSVCRVRRTHTIRRFHDNMIASKCKTMDVSCATLIHWIIIATVCVKYTILT